MWWLVDGAVLHNDATRGIEAPRGFVRDNRSKSRTEHVGRDHVEAKPRIEWHIPGYVAKRAQGQHVAVGRGPITNGQNELSPEPAAAVLRMYIELVEVRMTGPEQLDMGKAHRHIVSEGNPEKTLTCCFLEFVQRCCLEQHQRRRVASEQSGRRELDRLQQWQIAWPSDGNRI